MPSKKPPIDDEVLENSITPEVDDELALALDDDGESLEEPIVYPGPDDDEQNLAAVFMAHPDGKEALAKISKQVITDFDDDWEATEEYRQRMADDWKLFAGELPKKEWPYDKSANAHLPLMLENITRISTRMYAELFGDWSRVFDVLSEGPDDDNIAAILTRHGNWQLGNQLPDFKRQQARGVLMFCTAGDVTCHSYYDPSRMQNAHEMLTPDEFVTPFSHVTTMPDYSDLPHVAKVIYRYRHELEAMEDTWVDVDKVLERQPPSWEDQPGGTFRKATADAQKIIITDSKSSNAYKLIWYEGWLDLPDIEGQRFCQVIVDYATHAVLSLTIHEEEDWQDRARFDQQTAEAEAYTQALNQHTQMAEAHAKETAKHQAALAAHGEIRAEIGQIAVDPQHGADLEAALPQEPMAPQPLPPAPPPPDWMQMGATAPKPVRMVPLHMFSHGVCIEPLVGNLGLSFGRQQADHNRAVDTWASQFTDAATLSNSRTLLTTAAVEFDRPFQVAPGKVNKIKNVLAGDIDKHIKELSIGQANPQLMELMSLIWDKAQSSIQSSPVLSGEAGKSGETFRGMNSRIEQASKQLSVPTGFYGDFFKQVVRNNAKLNYLFLREEEVFMVNDDRAGTMPELRIGRKLYGRNYQIKLASDMTFATMDQKIASADECVQMPQAVPALQTNALFQYKALVKSLLLRGRQDLVDALGPPPPPPQVPFGTPPPMPPGMPPGAPGAGGGAPAQ